MYASSHPVLLLSPTLACLTNMDYYGTWLQKFGLYCLYWKMWTRSTQWLVTQDETCTSWELECGLRVYFNQKMLYVDSKTVRYLNAFGGLDYLDDEGKESDTDEHDGNRFIDKSGREVSNQIDKEMMQLQLRYWWSFVFVVTASIGRISVVECGQIMRENSGSLVVLYYLTLLRIRAGLGLYE